VLENIQRQLASEKAGNIDRESKAPIALEALTGAPVNALSKRAAEGETCQTNGKAHVLTPKPAHELPALGFRFTARNKSTLTATQIEQNGETIRIRAGAVDGWARAVLQAAPLEEIIQRNLLFSLRVCATGKAAKFKSAGIGFYKDKTFHLAYTSGRNGTIAAGENFLSIQPPRGVIRRLAKELDGKSPMFVFLEFTEPVEIEIDRFKAVEAKANSIPYLEADGDVHDKLRDLNASLFLEGKRDLLSWLTSEAEVALRLECFETAARLVNILLSRIDDAEPKLKKRILSICVETAFGEGSLDELRTTLLNHIEIVRQDDYLFTALSLCWPAYADDMERQDAVSAFSHLPSGNNNRAFLAANDLFTRAHGILSALKGEEPEAYLMAANFFRTKDPAAYRIMMNKYLDRFGLTPLTCVTPQNGNVLASLSFPVSEKQLSGPKISVIMATHNAAETVGYAMRSILDQTYSNLELLVCDDSSADGSLAEVEKFSADPRVRIFRSKKNQGPYNIRNALIAGAGGEFITFADSDDFSHPQRLERQIQVLLTSDAAACFGRWLRITPDGRVAFFRDHRCLRMSVVSFMARKSLFERFGGYRSSLCGADSEFLEHVRLALGRTEVVELEFPLIFGLWSTQSLTRQAGLEATEDGFRSSKRRAYAEIATRRRLLGPELVPESAVTGKLAEVGLFRKPAGVLPHSMGI